MWLNFLSHRPRFPEFQIPPLPFAFPSPLVSHPLARKHGSSIARCTRRFRLLPRHRSSDPIPRAGERPTARRVSSPPRSTRGLSDIPNYPDLLRWRRLRQRRGIRLWSHGRFFRRSTVAAPVCCRRNGAQSSPPEPFPRSPETNQRTVPSATTEPSWSLVLWPIRSAA